MRKHKHVETMLGRIVARHSPATLTDRLVSEAEEFHARAAGQKIMSDAPPGDVGKMGNKESDVKGGMKIGSAIASAYGG